MTLLAKDIMWSAPPMIAPSATLQEAASKMAEVNAGVLPVGKDGKAEGIITDRDIVVRAVSKGKDPTSEKVSRFMTRGLHSCRESDTLNDAAQLMKKNRVSRLAVLNDKERFSGILSFGHIFRNDANADEAVEIVTRVSERNRKMKKAAAG
jgi:CBS domain-containing protein